MVSSCKFRSVQYCSVWNHHSVNLIGIYHNSFCYIILITETSVSMNGIVTFFVVICSLPVKSALYFFHFYYFNFLQIAMKNYFFWILFTILMDRSNAGVHVVPRPSMKRKKCPRPCTSLLFTYMLLRRAVIIAFIQHAIHDFELKFRNLPLLRILLPPRVVMMANSIPKITY